MAFKMKTIASAIALSMVAGTAMAAEKKSANEGKWSGMVKLQHVVAAKDNGYDPNSGQAWMLKLKYLSPKMNGFQFGSAFYAVDDVFDVTDTRVIPGEGRPASGLYATDGENAGSELEPYLQGIFGELYVTYKQKKYDAYAGRMIFSSPLTKSAESTVPDFHTVAGANFKINKQFKFGLAHMVEASMGTRAANEYGLIGEGTRSGGTVVQPLGPVQNNPGATSLNRVEFHELSDIAGVGEDTAGMTILNANYRPSKSVNIALWDYYAHDIFNAVYAEATHSSKIAGKKKLILSGQYLTQTEVGDKLAGDIDFSLFGAKAEVKSKKWGAHIAMNSSSGDTEMFNAFSGDPGYTSTQFSRNEYRQNVNAYQIGARYSFNKKWIAKVNYANYGKSDTSPSYNNGDTVYSAIPGLPGTNQGPLTNTNAITAQKDAEEMDIKLIWKATKKGTVVVTHSIRTSEYDGFNDQDLTMAHTRLIGIYRF